MNELVDEAQAAADQAAADALQAAIDAAAAQSKAQEALDAALLAVVSSVIEYAVGESDTVPPTVGWSTDNPEPGDGEFVWMRTVVTYADESTATSLPVLMSRGGGGESVKIDSISGFYALVALEPFPPVMPELPTTIDPVSPWVQYVPAYAEGFMIVRTDRIIYTDESFAYTGITNVPGWAEAGEALAEAEATRFLAEGLYQVIPSVTEPSTSPTGALKQGDQWWKIGTGDDEGRFIGVAVWDGAQWQDRQIVADSLLVPGSVGSILIGDGQITGPAIATDALDAKTIRNGQFYSGYIEAPTIASSDRLGTGANKLVDPAFTSTLDTAWVASGHLGDADVTQVDTITWNQTWTYGSKSYRNEGNVKAELKVSAQERATGTLVFANFSWLNKAARSISNPYMFVDGRFHNGGFYDPTFKEVDSPPLATPTARTSYLTNSATISVSAGQRWNMRLEFTPVRKEHQGFLSDLSVQLIDASTSAVVYEYSLNSDEWTAGQVNAWWDSTFTGSVKFQIKATYTAGSGGSEPDSLYPMNIKRRATASSYARQKEGTTVKAEWLGSGSDPWLNYDSYPTSAGTRQSIGGSRGYMYRYRAGFNLAIKQALFAEVEPTAGWRLTEADGLEMFDALGAKTVNLDGADNYFTGRTSTAESGARWEMVGTSLTLYSASDSVVSSLTLNGSTLQVTGPVSFQGDTDWSTTSLTTGTGKVSLKRCNNVVTVAFAVSATYGTSGHVSIATIPAEHRPDARRVGAGWFAGTSYGDAVISAGGVLSVANNTGTSRSYCEGSITYVL